LAAHYLPADHHEKVGGDRYDAVTGPDGRLTMVIGDVVGHDNIATAVVAALDTFPSGQHRLRWSNAGHPPPVVIHPDGTVQSLTGNDLLLGARRFARRHLWTTPLTGGSTVLLHTDGLLDRADDPAGDATSLLHRRLRTSRRSRRQDLIEDATARADAPTTSACQRLRLPADA
jgi:serine phosphatase RsbU (regulator of sigma subunit)